MSPFTGYNFKDDVIGNYRSAHGILTAHQDDPFENIALAKMRKNIHCLANPQHFDGVKEGTLSFQKNHNVILKDPKHPNLQNRMKSVRLEDLPMNQRAAILSPDKNQGPVKAHPIAEPRVQTSNDAKALVAKQERPVATEPAQGIHHSKSQSLGIGAHHDSMDDSGKKNMFKIKSSGNLKKHSFNQSQPEMYLNSMISESNPVFRRKPINTRNMFGAPSTNLYSYTKFDDRIKTVYNPGIKDKNYARWNVDKNNLLQYMNKHKDAIKSNPNLVKHISELKGITGLQRHFPTNIRYMACPPKSVLNDAHCKNTNAGYVRNDNGGIPYFS